MGQRGALNVVQTFSRLRDASSVQHVVGGGVGERQI